MARRATSALLAALAVIALPGEWASAKAPPRAHASVVGGQAAPKGRYPWMVALSRGCGGTLIAPDRVLTAGHCVEDMRITELRVYVGAFARQRGTYRYDGVEAEPVDVATHPGYRSLEGGGPENDVAVIRLAEPVEGITPVKLATRGQTPLFSGGKLADVIGWGVTRTDLRNAPLATGLRRGRLRILPSTTCRRIYGRDQTYRSGSMLCARSAKLKRRPNTSPCLGDSGGPLVIGGDVQVGIVSFGISCGALHEPTVFTRVAAMRSFIDAAGPVWAPQALGRPQIIGDVRPGAVVTCQPPEWRNPVDRITYRWGLNGVLVATGRSVRVTSSAAGRNLQCRAVAANDGGETPGPASPAVRVPAGR